MLNNVAIVNKSKGQTPLQSIQELVKNRPELASKPLTYAGRLDPLAEGVLVILIGDECMKKDMYLALPKEYLVTILFGFATDTYDVMGKVCEMEATPSEMLFERSSDLLAQNSKNERGQTISNNTSDSVALILKDFTGNITQAYPPYSSRTVDGKPLFMWAREGKLDQIQIPTHNVYIYSISIENKSEITGGELLEKINHDISMVSGDFRQDEIMKLWDKALVDKKDIKYKTITLRVVCGSGVYMRTLAYDIGKILGTNALALDIIRTKVGEYSI